MREAIETPGRTAALVTPDRTLAERVAAVLARWDIRVDDSAGQPLSRTPPGALLLVLAELAADIAPVPLLSPRGPPLVSKGGGRTAWLAQLGRAACRGRGSQYVVNAVVAVSYKKKNTK